MKNESYNNLISHAIVFRQQIRREFAASRGKNWTWEMYFPGPLSQAEAETIMGISGCWCENPTATSVRFYTNQNHPIWSAAKQRFS